MSRSYDLVSSNRPAYGKIHCQQKYVDDDALLLADLLPAAAVIISEEDESPEMRFSSKKSSNGIAKARRLAFIKNSTDAVASSEHLVRNRQPSKDKLN